MRLKFLAVLALLSVTAACAPKAQIECTSSSASATTIELVKQQLEKAVTDSLKASGDGNQVLASKIRATIQLLTITLEDVRTTKQDPNSTKKFCTASLHISIPPDLLSDAEKARSSATLTDVSALANSTNVDRNANVFNSDFEYNVQPTDTGDKVYSESEDFGKIRAFYAEVVSSALLKVAVEQVQLQAQQSANAQKEQEAAALVTQRTADHDQASTENQLANQTITAVWKNIDATTRGILLDDQRAWIKKKTADCAVEAAAASVDAAEQDTAKLKCDTRLTQERLTFLKTRTGVASRLILQLKSTR